MGFLLVVQVGPKDSGSVPNSNWLVPEERKNRAEDRVKRSSACWVCVRFTEISGFSFSPKVSEDHLLCLFWNVLNGVVFCGVRVVRVDQNHLPISLVVVDQGQGAQHLGDIGKTNVRH